MALDTYLQRQRRRRYTPAMERRVQQGTGQWAYTPSQGEGTFGDAFHRYLLNYGQRPQGLGRMKRLGRLPRNFAPYAQRVDELNAQSFRMSPGWWKRPGAMQTQPGYQHKYMQGTESPGHYNYRGPSHPANRTRYPGNPGRRGY